jgi:hypothetical protein
MKHPILPMICIALVASACASVSVSGTPAATARETRPTHECSADLQGRWVGTYFQDNEHRGYPMELTADGAPNSFAVTLEWPTLSGARTVGHGSSSAGSVAWTEEQMVQGKNIVLGGRYEAALIDPDTLAGVYEKNHVRMGFFTLSRAHGSETPSESAGAAFNETAVREPNALAIGECVPDIEGEDLDGVRFKLSDYRGKVVMLEFWGNW